MPKITTESLLQIAHRHWGPLLKQLDEEFYIEVEKALRKNTKRIQQVDMTNLLKTFHEKVSTKAVLPQEVKNGNRYSLEPLPGRKAKTICRVAQRCTYTSDDKIYSILPEIDTKYHLVHFFIPNFMLPPMFDGGHLVGREGCLEWEYFGDYYPESKPTKQKFFVYPYVQRNYF